jgi:hypothetical protein
VARLPGTSLLGVIGPSGSGKSSAVRAGVLPALTAGVLPGSERWKRVVLRPGERPLERLRHALEADTPEAALAWVEPGSRLLVVVDQFEELFTACRAPAERTAFIDALIQRDDRFLAVLALRADFYGACAAHPELARLLGENHVLVGAMRPDELARAIEVQRPRPVSPSTPSSCRAWSRRRRARPAGCRCCPARCWSSGSAARATA